MWGKLQWKLGSRIREQKRLLKLGEAGEGLQVPGEAAGTGNQVMEPGAGEELPEKRLWMPGRLEKEPWLWGEAAGPREVLWESCSGCQEPDQGAAGAREKKLGAAGGGGGKPGD